MEECFYHNNKSIWKGNCFQWVQIASPYKISREIFQTEKMQYHLMMLLMQVRMGERE